MSQYSSGAELLALCRSQGEHIDDIALKAETEYSGIEMEQIKSWLAGELLVMRDSIRTGLDPELESMGG